MHFDFKIKKKKILFSLIFRFKISCTRHFRASNLCRLAVLKSQERVRTRRDVSGHDTRNERQRRGDTYLVSRSVFTIDGMTSRPSRPIKPRFGLAATVSFPDKKRSIELAKAPLFPRPFFSPPLFFFLSFFLFSLQPRISHIFQPSLFSFVFSRCPLVLFESFSIVRKTVLSNFTRYATLTTRFDDTVSIHRPNDALA